MCASNYIIQLKKPMLHLYYSILLCNNLQIPADQNSTDPSRAEQQIIKYLCVSPSEENLVCSTDLNQLYNITLSTADLGKVCQFTHKPIFLNHL